VQLAADRRARRVRHRTIAINNVLGLGRALLSFTGRIEYSCCEGPDIFRMGGMSEISKRWVGPVLVAAALVTLTTSILLAMYLAWQAEHLIFGYLMPITFVAVRYGSAPAIVTTVVSDLCAAYFLYPPDFSIYIADPLQVAELSFFSVLVLATSQFIGGFADDERLLKRTAPYKKA
jgi:K+-sensing histidine kinase KdpD